MSEPVEQIAQARTLDEVVAATGQYLARWNSDSLALIPRRCRPHWIGSAEDIEMCTGQLHTECARREATGTPISQELAVMRGFFADAAGAIARIKQQGEPGDAEAAWLQPHERLRWGYSSGLSKR